MKAYIYINYSNTEVIKDYLEVVKNAFEKMGYACEFITSMKGISRKSVIVYPMGKDAIKYYFKGYCKFVIWQQGATADESYMRNRSKARRIVLNLIDVFAMRKARFIFYVSEYMKSYYEKKAHCSFSQKSYVMPCYNEIYDESTIKNKSYDRHSFAYVGSLDLWQCFDKIVEIYKSVEKAVPDCCLKVLTFQENEAKKILVDKGVVNYIVKRVPKEQVKSELSECTYGFLIREDNIVNRVATPTKISSYLAAGVIPVFSECLEDFKMIAEKNKLGYAVGNQINISDFLQYVLSKKDEKQIWQAIAEVFNTYYNKNAHINKIYEHMKDVFNN